MPMPSPFPGMDPYLENPVRWPGVHHALLAEIRRQLNQVLQPRYVALVEERVYISDQEDPGRRVIIPDVLLQETPAGKPRITIGNESMLAVAQPIELELADEEVHDSFLEIRTVDDHRVVTVIEVFSPTNKLPGAYGQELFRRKRREVMASTSHWMEIDLLREGERSTPQEVLPMGDYFVHISRAGQRRKSLVWPIRLPQRLPVVTVPLLPEDGEVSLDLQSVLTNSYDDSAFGRIIDYRLEPVPPLPERYTAWADELLTSQGLRP